MNFAGNINRIVSRDPVMIQTKNSKEMFVVNFKEIPETICVETRFITKAIAKQKKDHTLYYMNVNRGQVELSKYEVPPSPATIASAQIKDVSMGRSKQPTVTVSIRNKPMILNKPITVTSVMTNANVQQPPPYSGHGVSVTPLGLSMSAPYSTNMQPDAPSFAMPPPIARLPTPAPLSTVTIPMTNPIMHNIHFNPPALRKKPVEMKDSGCMTEPKAQEIHRAQQTEDTTPKMLSVAIQCCIDSEERVEALDDFGTNEISVAIEQGEEEEKEQFLRYVQENSIEYKNHFRECLICGEVCKKSKYFYGHMAVHKGPKVLCYRCGQYLDHEYQLKRHSCTTAKRVARALLRCPQNKCNVTALSRLELYDHINEHKNYRDHKCSACDKEFCTAQEFLRHLLLRAKCYTDAKRNRNRLYGLRSKADRLCRVRVFTLHTHSKRRAMVKSLLAKRASNKNICEICFRPYRNKYIFNRHMKKCAALFKKRSARHKKK